MALFDVEFPEDFLRELLDTEFGEIAEEALREAAPVLENKMKTEARRVIDHEGDSEMAESFEPSDPKKTKTDAWIVNVTPRGQSSVKVYTAKYKGKRTHRKYKVSNALKAIWKEYGIPGRQAARPFITASINASKKEVLEHMQEVYNRKVGAK